MPFPDRAEKLARITSLFESKLTRKDGKSFGTSEAPLIFGVTLRAMHRRSLGLELSNFEKSTSGLWAAFVSDKEEMAVYGKLFSQQKFTKNFPKVITQLPIEKPYTGQNYFHDVVKTSTPEAIDSAHAHFNVVDLATFDKSKPMAPKGGLGGCTLVTSSNPPKTSNAESKSMTEAWSGNWSLNLNDFYCGRQGTDAFGGPKNEIYWGYAGANDVAPSECTLTRVYGSVESHNVYDMSRDGYKMKIGSTLTPGRYFCTHFECWEQDDSGDEWVEKLKQGLLDVGGLCLDISEIAAVAGPEAELVLVGIAGISILVAGLIAAFVNDDDLVLEQSILFDHAAIYDIYRRYDRKAVYEFDGGNAGFHNLALRVDG